MSIYSKINIQRVDVSYIFPERDAFCLSASAVCSTQFRVVNLVLLLVLLVLFVGDIVVVSVVEVLAGAVVVLSNMCLIRHKSTMEKCRPFDWKCYSSVKICYDIFEIFVFLLSHLRDRFERQSNRRRFHLRSSASYCLHNFKIES